jgi:negative modulator of initiation of replication
MRTIDVDDDVFYALESISGFNKIPIAQVVRQLMPSIRSSPSASTNATRPAPSRQDHPSPRDKAVRDYVQSPTFLAGRAVVDLFLSLLSFLHKENPDRFGILESMEGRTRKYIARSERELEDSGTSVNPKRIPNSGYWVVTNNDTNNKKMLLRQALMLLGYSAETIRLVPESLR